MKEETINQLIQKYKNGETTLKEEEKLFDNVKENQPEIKILADFKESNQIKIPHHFNDKLWKSFDAKLPTNKRFKIGVFSAAASIVLLLSFYFGNLNNNKLSYSEKQALLNEAKNMFTDAEVKKTIHNIIIETDFIIVYTKTE